MDIQSKDTESKGFVTVHKCSDPSLWYAKRVGSIFPVIRDLPNEKQWLVRDKATGYSNVIKYTDGMCSPSENTSASLSLESSQQRLDDLQRRVNVGPISGAPYQGSLPVPPAATPFYPNLQTGFLKVKESKNEDEAVLLSAMAQDVLREIAKERVRQVTKEGWSEQHDDRYTNGELSRAAGSYVLHKYVEGAPPPMSWPWPDEWWKPSKDSKYKDLIKAAALIVAELERMRREGAKCAESGGRI